jgi:hypothetical protein
MVVDEKEDQKFDKITSIIFSPIANTVSMLRYRGKTGVVIDGTPSKKYDKIVVTFGGTLLFNPDSTSLHYYAIDGQNLYS